MVIAVVSYSANNGSIPFRGSMKYTDSEYPVIGWKIYYGNGETRNSDEHSSDEIPDQDVQVLRIFFCKGEKIRSASISGIDYYQIPNTSRILYGKFMGTLENPECFTNLYLKAVADPWQPNIF